MRFFLHQLQPLRDGVVHRALPAAVRVAAVQAASGLVLGIFLAELAVQLAPVAGRAQFHRDALRHGAGQVEELEGVLAAHGGLWNLRSPASGRPWRSCAGGALPLRGASQGFGQRLDAGGLGFDQPELADVIAELVEDLLRPDAAGQLAVAADQAVQVLAVVLEALGGDAVDVDQLVVVAVDEIAVTSST
jgi:hypothetical protein